MLVLYFLPQLYTVVVDKGILKHIYKTSIKMQSIRRIFYTKFVCTPNNLFSKYKLISTIFLVKTHRKS